MVSSGGCEQPPNARFALRSHRVLCAQPRRQHQKLRPAGTELLAEFRAPARIARCERTEKGGLFLFIDFLILSEDRACRFIHLQDRSSKTRNAK